MKKIAFIVQRYGLEVNGGAEYYCRILAERLKAIYEVEVLTTCALDYVTWTNHYPAGASDVNGINVLRFPTTHERDVAGFDEMTYQLTKKPHPDEKKWVTLLKTWTRPLTGKTARYSVLWAEYQGPYVPELIQYLKQHHKQYDVLVFFTYLYYPTIEGIRIAPRKSILIPTAHDEPAIYLPVFKKLFSLPKAILYISAGEKRFVDRAFRPKARYSDMIGVGIEPAQAATERSAASLLGTDSDYLIYIGRIDPDKGCDVLFEYFRRYKKENPSSLKLVLVGQAFMPIPDHPDLRAMGFVDEGVKITLLKGAKALVMPSPHESLSMVTLESFSYGIPVIANAACEVLKDHVEISQAGFLFKSYADFNRAVRQLLSQNVSEMARKAQMYIEQNYTWDTMLAKFTKAVDYVTAR